MRQSTAVVLALMAAFLVFVTVRGELPAYLAVLFGPVPAAAGASSGGGASGTAATVSSAASTAGGFGAAANAFSGLFGLGIPFPDTALLPSGG